MKNGMKTKRRTLPVLLLAIVLLFFVITPTGAATPIPAVTGPVPVTATSVPFMSVSRLVTPTDLAKVGYVEEEYFLERKSECLRLERGWINHNPRRRSHTRTGYWSVSRSNRQRQAAP